MVEYDVVSHLNDRFDDVPKESDAEDPARRLRPRPQHPLPDDTHGIYTTARGRGLFSRLLPGGSSAPSVDGRGERV